MLQVRRIMVCQPAADCFFSSVLLSRFLFRQEKYLELLPYPAPPRGIECGIGIRSRAFCAETNHRQENKPNRGIPAPDLPAQKDRDSPRTYCRLLAWFIHAERFPLTANVTAGLALADTAQAARLFFEKSLDNYTSA
jgi:hypothetical protein